MRTQITDFISHKLHNFTHLYSFVEPFIDIMAGEIEGYMDGETETTEDNFEEQVIAASKQFCRDLEYGGCGSGMIGELIYYDDTKEYYSKHFEDMEQFLLDQYGDSNMFSEYVGPRYNYVVWATFEELALVYGTTIGY